MEGERAKAVNYNAITGYISIGDRVILNTTAVELSLGTGGYHFVIYNKKHKEQTISNDLGHIMKLRYTPLQFKCLAAEEQDSKYHDKFNSFKSLDNSIYIVGTLHSMLAPIASVIKWLRPELKITYIMTDAGALSLHFSKTVKRLKNEKIIENTITIGHAFGGDLECVNIYTGIIAAKTIANSDVTIIAMGPGIVGTGTKYGFSGIEQGYIIDAVNKLGGLSFAVPRISFADERERHKGISHHTLTILNDIVSTKTNLALPVLNDEYADFINNQIKSNDLDKKHNIFFENGSEVIDALNYYGLDVKTMGRSYYDDEAFFHTLGAVAKVAINFLDSAQ
ncbi:DUF3866 family protein [Proteiniborus sp. DW1]|uniref:DUF3866 family protein n=1 Tax=Proteiniborus sp. DW1 TaxID=1889883 RepID=UPI00325B12FB